MPSRVPLRDAVLNVEDDGRHYGGELIGFVLDAASGDGSRRVEVPAYARWPGSCATGSSAAVIARATSAFPAAQPRRRHHDIVAPKVIIEASASWRAGSAGTGMGTGVDLHSTLPASHGVHLPRFQCQLQCQRGLQGVAISGPRSQRRCGPAASASSCHRTARPRSVTWMSVPRSKPGSSRTLVDHGKTWKLGCRTMACQICSL